MDEVLLSENRQGILWLTLNRPQARNALNRQLSGALKSAFEAASGDPSVRAIVLTAAGGQVLCAGADLKEDNGRMFEGGAGSNPIADVMRAMRACDKLVIGRINGSALAGGLGLVSACDLAYAADHARFGLPEVRVGVFPLMVSVPLLRQVSRRKLEEMAYLGATLDAGEAEACGLVNRSILAADLDARIADILDMIRQNAPGATAFGKRALGELAEMDVADGLARAEVMIATLGAAEEAQEGRRAFAEKRKPAWANSIGDAP